MKQEYLQLIFAKEIKIHVIGGSNILKGTNTAWEIDVKRGIGYENSWKEASISEYDESSRVFCQILKEEVMTEQKSTRRVGIQRWE